MLSVNDILAKTVILNDLDNIDERFDHSEPKNSTDLSLHYQSRYSIDDHRIGNNSINYHMWSGEFEPMFEIANDKRPRALLTGIKESFHHFISNDDFEITKHISRSPSTDHVSNNKDEDRGDDQATISIYPKIGKESESMALKSPKKGWTPLDGTFESQIKPTVKEYHPQTSMDYYLQEFNDGINQLTRWSIRMEELKRLDPEEFKIALSSFRDHTGENPLRTWTVKVNTVIGLMRDIQYDMETGISSLD